jgi:hypothetical protein
MTLSLINALRAIHAEADRAGPCPKIDADIEREAGMDGNYARLLQAARNFDQARAEMIANDDPRYPSLRDSEIKAYDLCIQTACPTCGAKAGEFCSVWQDNTLREVPHKTRTGR